MKVDIGNRKYTVGWKHTLDGTECRIRVLDTETEVYGVSHKNPKDSMNKNVGRKLSLERALQQIPDLVPKENRILFWNEYFKMRNGQF